MNLKFMFLSIMLLTNVAFIQAKEIQAEEIRQIGSDEEFQARISHPSTDIVVAIGRNTEVELIYNIQKHINSRSVQLFYAESADVQEAVLLYQISSLMVLVFKNGKCVGRIPDTQDLMQLIDQIKASLK